MPLTLPFVRVGKPLRHHSLTIFPLFTDVEPVVDYRLSDDAITAEALVVTEVSEQGSVPELLVDNRGDKPVLFLEGEMLVGAKQDRVLNTSLLVAAGIKMKVPVSCVERGRWARRSLRFGSSPRSPSPSLRRSLKKSVSSSLRRMQRHTSDQGAVWRTVEEIHRSHRVTSQTRALSDAYEQTELRAEDFRQRLRYEPGSRGLVAALGGRVVMLELYDRAETCARMWDRLLSGLVLEALSTPLAENPVEAEAVERLLAAAEEAAWEEVTTPGEGEEYRATLGGDPASALTCEGSLLHESVLVD